MARRPQLIICGGRLDGRRFDVPEGGLRLGRSSSNDIPIPDEELSRNHCFFEPSGEDGIRLTDLASANGTTLNGVVIGSDPVELQRGDVIEVGRTIVRVGEIGGEDPTVRSVRASGRAKVDLGFAEAMRRKTPGEAAESARPQVSKRLVLWLIAALVVVTGGVILLLAPGHTEPEAPVPVADDPSVVVEFSYEKVKADSGHIFRYELSLSPDRVLSVRVDDIPGEDRHSQKSRPLTDQSFAALGDILDFRKLKDIDREYAGIEPDPPALDARTLRVVYSNRSRIIRVANTDDPEAFREIRERLESFAKNELGIWAIQYPREQLVEFARQAFEIAEAKWADRDVEYGNLAASVSSYREAIVHLETVNPAPDFLSAAKTGLERATAELGKRFDDRRFLADRAMKLSQWTEAKTELQALLEMVPDRDDPRHRETRAKLLDVEKKLQGK